MSDTHLRVSRAELTAVAKRLSKGTTPKRLRAGQLALRFEDGALWLEILGAVDSLPAQGHWRGTLRVPGIVLVYFAKGEPPGDPIELSLSEGKLLIRGGGALVKFPGQWEDISPDRLDLPLDASDRDYMRLSLRDCSPAQIVAAGLDKQVQACEERFQKAIDRAVPIFSRYRISRTDLEAALRSLILKPGD